MNKSKLKKLFKILIGYPLIILYNVFILRITSLFINLKKYFSVSKDKRKVIKEDIKVIYKNLKDKKTTAETIFKKYNKYVIDPVINNKYTANFIIWLSVFLIQGGSDCSGQARIFKKLKEYELKRKGTLYLIMQPYFKISTSHVFYMWYEKGYYNIFNVGDIHSFSSKEEAIYYVKHKNYSITDNTKINYKDSILYKWF
jgi:hypothetical protein